MNAIEIFSDFGFYLRATGNGVALLLILGIMAVCALVRDEPIL